MINIELFSQYLYPATNNDSFDSADPPPSYFPNCASECALALAKNFS